jgi:uncharacterized membrane protein
MNKMLILHIFTGAVLLAVGLLMKLLPPKKINSFYGYRTARSMKSQLAWDEANSYSADLMLWASISTLLVQIILFFSIGGHESLLISLGYYLLFIGVLVFLTEKRLKRKGF